MAERVRFPGDPKIAETGSGQEPQIPLNRAVPPTTVEMLQPDEDDELPAPPPRRVKGNIPPPDPEDEDESMDEEDDGGPAYSRERIGSRIGEGGPEAMAAIETVEKQLDTEDYVPCIFPKTIKLQDKGIMHEFGPGVHMVPVSLAGSKPSEMHWWLKAHKVKRTQRNPIPNPNKADEPEDV